MPAGYQLTPAEQAALAENGSARDKAAAASGQFAQTFNQPIANQGVRSGATQVPNASTPPPNAPAAPTAGKENLFTGLCEALNAHQQELVKSKQYEIADVYEIVFDPPSLGGALVKKPGTTNLSTTAMQTPNSATKVDPASNKVAINTQSWQVLHGTQIVQLIDHVMRSSTFITDQQLWQYDPVFDPKTGIQQLVKNPSAGNGVTWFKISVRATQLGVDNKRKDSAYKMTFIITPYRLAQMSSEYFATIPYRGVHKSYNYWFTGLNTQILNFEQQYNNMYHLTLSGIGNGIVQNQSVSYRDQYRKTFMAASASRTPGATGKTNEPGDNAAAFLYDPEAQAHVKLTIVGDPAWLQQGEVSTGVSVPNFNFNPFNADGGINFDSQQILFDVSFNQPTDYNFNTGIMDVNSKNTARNGPLGGLPQQNFTYVATRCKSTFSKGEFKQELEGKLVIEQPTTPATAAAAVAGGNGRAGAPAAPTASGSRDTANSAAGSGYQNEAQQNADGNGSAASSGYQNEAQQNADNGPATPQPASPPGAPNSDGSIVGGSDTPPPKIDTNSPIQANAEETAAVQAYVAAGGTFPRGTGPITSGPLYDAVLSAKSSLAARQQASAVNTTPPQVIAKDDS